MDQKILERVMSYCAKAERSPRHVKLFLLRREVPTDEISLYMAELSRQGFYDPRRYAECYARMCYRDKSYGVAKIRQALRQQGIDAETTGEAISLAMTEEEPEHTLSELLWRKYERTTAKSGKHLYDKLMRYGVGRGYTPSEVWEALQEILQDYRKHALDEE